MSYRQTMVLLTASIVLGTGTFALAQVPSAGDMQQKLDQEMTSARRSASDSASSMQQGTSRAKSEAERKMEDTANEHKNQAEGKMSEAIEKAKRKSQGLDR